MRIHKLETTDAFLAIDLADPPLAAGVVRAAGKILPEGARIMARSLTYGFATLEMRRAGCSGGVNAKPADRAGAVARFVEEVAPMVADGRLALDPGRGLDPDALAPLREQDPRPPLARQDAGAGAVADVAEGRGVAAAAAAALGGLDGRTVALEGFGPGGPALVEAVAEWGGRVVALSADGGTAADPDRLEPGTVAAAWREHGTGLAAGLGGGGAPDEVFGVDCDVLVTGSKVGIVDHELAGDLAARAAVVGWGPAPLTAKALAVLSGRGVRFVPEFVACAGRLLAWFPPEGAEAATLPGTASDSVGRLAGEVLDHDHGTFVAACERAEAFLATWQDELPWGRPLA